MADMIDDGSEITFEEAKNALEDPEKGSLRVLKALGRQRDLFSNQLLEGAVRLQVKNDFEQVAAEAALEAYMEQLLEEGAQPPRIVIARQKSFFK
ncbi:MAG: hypothetical protein LBT62_02635 [Deltaproteobacteria bacterium]|jgi:hypothetical protein|nr:hypothetical protein [Deltaproteobacteria bacterium]